MWKTSEQSTYSCCGTTMQAICTQMSRWLECKGPHSVIEHHVPTIERNGQRNQWKLINDIKLEYLCRNKLPGIIFVLMHGDDYVINTSSIRPRVRRWLMGKCHKHSSRVVVGCSVDLKRKVDDQTIVDNCKISRTKIGFIKSVNGSFLG